MTAGRHVPDHQEISVCFFCRSVQQPTHSSFRSSPQQRARACISVGRLLCGVVPTAV
jgi:hypothetical protein